MLDGAGRRLARGRRHRRGAPLRDHHAGGSGNLGCAADGSEVVRVLNLIQGDDQALAVVPVEQRVRIRIRVGIHLRHHALMVGGSAEPLELLGRGLGGPPDAMHRPPPPPRLRDRASPVDQLVLGH